MAIKVFHVQEKVFILTTTLCYHKDILNVQDTQSVQ